MCVRLVTLVFTSAIIYFSISIAAPETALAADIGQVTLEYAF